MDEKEWVDVAIMLKAKESSESATCLRKNLGAVLVSKFQPGKKQYFAYGWNGPPTRIDSCGSCKRVAKNWEGHSVCRAVHAERRALIHMAMASVTPVGATLYSFMGVPCKDCMLELIDAFISEIVVLEKSYYDDLSKELLKEWISNGGKFRVISDNVKQELFKER